MNATLEQARLFQELEALLARLGVPVRTESFDPRMFGDLSSRGGLCRLHGATVVLVDARAPMVDQIAVLAEAASQLDTDSIYTPPAVREVIETHRRTPKPKPVVRGRGRLRLIRSSEPDDDEPDD